MSLAHRSLIFLCLLYMTVKLITVILIYKVIHLGPFSATASTLIMPLWFFLGDIIAEVYGYKVAKQIIWMALICQFFFAFVCWGMINIDAPKNWPIQQAYTEVLGKLPRVSFASFAAIVLGAFINAKVLTQWKTLLNGRYFWLRSLGATAIGEAVFTIIAYLIEFLGVVSFSHLLQLMTMSYVVKLVVGPILVIPTAIITSLLKKWHGANTQAFEFNPFKNNDKQAVGLQTDTQAESK